VTYSIVARDPQTGQLGVAVQTRAFGVGAWVTWARAGVGAVATQAFTDRGYGPLGLALLEAAKAPADALRALVAADDERDVRQVAFVDAEGRSAVHTGERCIPEAGHQVGDGFSAQGNMLRSSDVWPAMAEAYAGGEGSLAQRLLAALDAGEAAGGDFRGRQSAALLVVSGTRSGHAWDERVMDVRVDDHAEPLRELRRLARLQEAYGRLGRAETDEQVDEAAHEARDAGVAADELAWFRAALAWQRGDREEVVRRFEPLVTHEPRWRGALDLLLSRDPPTHPA
jgi:uncharacterized Ntn-hydrolase superfamily protein